jgi:hypothetical protein
MQGEYAPTSRIKALDELLYFPHLNVLFRLVLTHFLRPLNGSERRRECCLKDLTRNQTRLPPGDPSFYFIFFPGPCHVVFRSSDHRRAKLHSQTTTMPRKGKDKSIRTSHRVNKLDPPRPFPTVPAGVSATGPRSAHREGKNYITVTRKTQLGAYIRRCKDVVLKDGCVTLPFVY